MVNDVAAEAPRIRIVLADDTEDVRLLLRIALGRDDRFEVVGEATNGAEAVEVAAGTQPDLVLLDLAMPVMDGMQAIPLIREQAPDTQIAVLTGFERSDIEAEVVKLGARAYLEKGMPLDQMFDTLAGLVSPAGAQRPRTRKVEAPKVIGPAHDLLSMLGHELSSPVAVIEGFATLIQREAGRLSTDEIVDFAGAIARGGNQLQALINSFYDARHLASGEFHIEPRLVSLSDVLRETVHDLESAAEAHPLSLDAGLDDPVEVDPVRVRQVVENLVLNAAKFSPPLSPIVVRAREIDGSIDIAVEDQGPGVPPEDESKLFDQFSKVRKGGPGLGLGLYISRGVARAHGGDLTYERTSENTTMFRLRLPKRR